MPTPESVGRSAQAAARGSTMTTVAAVGLVALGVVHLLIGWLALQIAWSRSEEQADPVGAFATLAEQPVGTALLWVAAVGLLGLAVWQLSEAVWGGRGDSGSTFDRVSSAGKAVAYAALALTAVRTATGGASGSGSEEGATARLLGAPAGQLLVGAVGLGIVAIGAYLAYKGVTKKFTEDLDGSTTSGQTGSAVVRLGQVGHLAKGIGYGIVGALVITAAVTHDPEESGGLDEALATVREQPYGQWLLTIVALGFVAYGLYAFAWARSVRARA